MEERRRMFKSNLNGIMARPCQVGVWLIYPP